MNASTKLLVEIEAALLETYKVAPSYLAGEISAIINEENSDVYTETHSLLVNSLPGKDAARTLAMKFSTLA